MSKYIAIGFDYGGVIGGVRKSNISFADEMSQILGIDTEEFRETYFDMNHLINLGEIASWKEFWMLFLDKLDKREKLDEVMELSDRSAAHLKEVDQEILGFIDELKAKGYKTGLLSNTTLEGGQDQRAAGIDKHFDVFHISAETKLMKPNPEAFTHLAEALDVNVNEMVFVDDAEKSLSTASEVGFTPLLFKSLEQLVSDLQKLGVD